MQKLRKVSIVGAAFLLAAATGHMMQTAQGPETATPLATAMSAAGPDAPAVRPMAVTGLTIADVAALPGLPARRVADEAPRAAVSAPVEPSVGGFAAANCAPATLTLEATKRGLVEVKLAAPCHPMERLNLVQGPLDVSLRLDAAGRWSGLIPALSSAPEVELYLPGGETLVEQVTAPGAEAVNRVLLLWTGAAEVHLNAYEYGSDYGGAGHVQARMPRTPDTPLGGYLMSYGGADDGAHAEIYSAPTGMTGTRFDLEAPVSAASCGRDLGATVVQIRAGQIGAPVPVTLAMPDCDQLEGSVVMRLPEETFSLAAAK